MRKFENHGYNNRVVNFWRLKFISVCYGLVPGRATYVKCCSFRFCWSPLEYPWEVRVDELEKKVQHCKESSKWNGLSLYRTALHLCKVVLYIFVLMFTWALLSTLNKAFIHLWSKYHVKLGMSWSGVQTIAFF